MPLEIASMPVIAVAPELNARSTSSNPTAWVAWTGGGEIAWKPRPAALTRPTVISRYIAAMNR
jgi:hypothetical protein